jgi:hypothetical protein
MAGLWILKNFIPDNVHDSHLIKLFAGKPLANDNSVDTKPCSRIVHPHVGGKLKYYRQYLLFES